VTPTRTLSLPALLLPLALLAQAAGCGGGGGGGGDAGGGGDGETTCPIPAAVANPTFRADVLPMLRLTCGANSAISCHGTPGPRGHVSFSPALSPEDVYAQLVNTAPANAPAGYQRIAAGDPGHSWLLVKVTEDDPGGAGQAYGNRMPLGLPDLCAPTVQTLFDWVSQGARDE
jgi:hypothetical protein